MAASAAREPSAVFNRSKEVVLNVGFRDRLVENDFAARHRYDAVTRLEDVIQVMAD